MPEEEIEIPVVSNEGAYCRWCGVDLYKGHNKGHLKNCPLIVLKEKASQKSSFETVDIAWGFEATDDPLLNLHIARMGILTSPQVGENGIFYGSENPQIWKRLVREHIKFWENRISTEEGREYLKREKDIFEDLTLTGENREDFLEIESKLQDITPKKTLKRGRNWKDISMAVVILLVAILIGLAFGFIF